MLALGRDGVELNPRWRISSSDLQVSDSSKRKKEGGRSAVSPTPRVSRALGDPIEKQEGTTTAASRTFHSPTFLLASSHQFLCDTTQPVNHSVCFLHLDILRPQANQQSPHGTISCQTPPTSSVRYSPNRLSLLQHHLIVSREPSSHAKTLQSSHPLE
jgi:hypothetical protein